MMHEFLSSQRAELIARCRAKVAKRTAPQATPAELEHGIPLFLDQLIKTLRLEQTSRPMDSRKVSGAAGGGSETKSEMGEGAAQHGRELMLQGFTVEQVVHDYGDLCQAITDLAFEVNAHIQVDEFRTLNRCLDNAIAVAVTEFTYQRDSASSAKQASAMDEQLGSFAHELRNLLNTATLAFGVLKVGNVGVAGATGSVLEKSLVGLRSLIDRSLSAVRMTPGMQVQHRVFSLAEFIAEVRVSASLEASARECPFASAAVDPALAVAADRDLLLGAVGNLLQNAFKFTHRHTAVTLSAYAIADRIRIDVEDHCGGLAPGAADAMFLPFTQFDDDKAGVGLGLSISKRSVQANDGSLTVRDVPGSGCVFTIDLPRRALTIPPVNSHSVN